MLRELKELGILPVPSDTPRGSSWRLPSIVETRPRPGHHHPATRADIAETLRFFGEECVYGIRAIELRQGTPGVRTAAGSPEAGAVIADDGDRRLKLQLPGLPSTQLRLLRARAIVGSSSEALRKQGAASR